MVSKKKMQRTTGVCVQVRYFCWGRKKKAIKGTCPDTGENAIEQLTSTLIHDRKLPGDTSEEEENDRARYQGVRRNDGLTRVGPRNPHKFQQKESRAVDFVHMPAFRRQGGRKPLCTAISEEDHPKERREGGGRSNCRAYSA